MADRRRIVWPEGAYHEAVVTHGWLDRWWAQFRMGWSLDPRKLRRVSTACDPTGEDYQHPRLAARRWERMIRELKRALA